VQSRTLWGSGSLSQRHLSASIQTQCATTHDTALLSDLLVGATPITDADGGPIAEFGTLFAADGRFVVVLRNENLVIGIWAAIVVIVGAFRLSKVVVVLRAGPVSHDRSRIIGHELFMCCDKEEEI
jgi:hypothetical protein